MIRPITVTAEDIAQGAPRSCARCPIARAIRRALALPEGHVHVRLDSVRFGVVSATPESVSALPVVGAEFIALYDHGYGVAPFCFDLDVPEGFGPGGGR